MDEVNCKARPDRVVQALIQSLSETVPSVPAQAAELEAWQRALRWQQGEKVPTPNIVPGQCRDC